MTDLTKITTPFGLLDKETQAALRAHGGPLEVFTSSGWRDVSFFSGGLSSTYRVKPAALIPDSIDWSHVAPELKWMARDADGSAYLFPEEPKFFGSMWTGNDFREVAAFASYRRGTVDWRDSLVRRPE